MKVSRNSKICICYINFNYVVEKEFQEGILDFCSLYGRGSHR
jgi:hypothetical protein